jgi:ABC-type lipoprotein release transport system permease subunit
MGVRGLLVGVQPLDGVAFAAAGTVLLVVLLTASWLPARRAAATDPASALRAE